MAEARRRRTRLRPALRGVEEPRDLDPVRHDPVDQYVVGMGDQFACSRQASHPALLRKLQKAFGHHVEIEIEADGRLEIVKRNVLENQLALMLRARCPDDPHDAFFILLILARVSSRSLAKWAFTSSCGMPKPASSSSSPC